MKKYFRNPLFWILVLALFLRLYKLGDLPFGFHVDEIKAGWNGLSIIETLKDDKGNLLPLYYNTFGDYRLTGIFYLTGPFVYLLGNTVFATRFASAVIGAFTIIPLYLTVKLIESNNKIGKKDLNVAYWASLVLAIMPWHIETSRATSEVVISLFFLMIAIYSFLKLIFKDSKISFVFFVLSLTTSYLLYHSVRVSAPLFIIGIFIYYYRIIKINTSKNYIIYSLIFTLLLSSFVSLGSSSKGRFNQVSIFNDKDVVYEVNRLKESNSTKGRLARIINNPYLVYTKNMIHEYGRYFSTDFLIGESAKPYRYTTSLNGILNLYEIILLILGVYYLVSKRGNYIYLILLALAPITASLTTEDSPNLHRALLMVPFIAAIEGYGIVNILSWKNKYRYLIRNIIIVTLAMGTCYFFFVYSGYSKNLKPFDAEYLVDSPTYRNQGNIELVKYIHEEKDKYDLVYISNFPDNLYSWYAYFIVKSPIKFNSVSYIPNSNERRYENIIFTDTKCPSDTIFSNNVKNILVIDSGECPAENKIRDGLKAELIKQIIRTDKSISYYIFKSK